MALGLGLMNKLPKIELHLHLDCSLSYRTVAALAPSVTREEYERDYRAPAKCLNLAQFLSIPPRSVCLLQTEEALRLAVEDVFEQLNEDGVIYAEIRFAPLLHQQQGLAPEQIVACVNDAVARVNALGKVQCRLILCALRHFSAEESLETARLVERFRGSNVVALDLAGDEAGYPVTAHVAAFRYAREHGCHCTAHAGEGAGAQSVWDTLRELRPTRIGHGVRSIEDASLVAHLKSTGVHLEICPSANVQIIESIANWQQHPIDRLYRAGVSLNVNTDSRTLTPVTLSGEYEQLGNIFGWTRNEFLRTNLMAADAAFIGDDVKAGLRAKLRAGYGD